MSVPSSVLFVQRNANSNFVFRDDPVWEDWYQDAHGVQGGLEDSGSSSESEDETAQPVILPTTCICNHCRLVPVLWIHDIFGWILIRIRVRILDPDPAIFVTDLQDASKKLIF